ncbi:MAG: hydroxymethylglutaryl-CoA synthase family protein [Alkalispirochaeta sp.]
MEKKTVGISDMSLFVPTARISLASILQRRAAEDPSFERRLRRAIESTEQVSLRFTRRWQDPVTMAAQASRILLLRTDAAPSIRYFGVGTESSVDMSKPIAAYAHGALQRSGVPLPRELSTFQVQHACAGGTIAMMSIAGMLQAAGRNGERGLVVCSDVARYDTPSTAEITQGAGAVAMLIEENPQLLELDLTTVGLASNDVDDFFRPLPSITARVKGRYSVECYNEALDTAFLDHARRSGDDPKTLLHNTDLFVVHVPFYKMAITGMTRLVEHYLGVSPSDAHEFLNTHHFYEGIEAARYIGNIYSGSAYMSLMFALWRRWKVEGAGIVGKRITLASYGSGNTMSVIGARVAKDAPAVLAEWDLQEILDSGADASVEAYREFVAKDTYTWETGEVCDGHEVEGGEYFLRSIRDDGYREYDFLAV